MATARIYVSPLPPFDPVSDPTSVGQRWTQWKRRFETYLVAANVKDDAQQRALLLYQAGAATEDIFETLPVAEDEAKDYKTALAKLDAHFAPQKNIDFETFQFRQAKQHIGETTDQFAIRLRKLAAHCEFHDLEKELKSAIVQNCLSKPLRRYALREEKLTLDKLLSKARSLEASEIQARDIEDSLEISESAKFVKKRTTQKCHQCGYAWPHQNKPCPARGQTCRKCGKTGHFAKVCKSRNNSAAQENRRQQTTQNKPNGPRQGQKPQIRQVQQDTTSQDMPESQDSSSEDDFIFTCDNNTDLKMPHVKVKINNTTIKMVLDTGVSIDILDETTFNALQKKEKIELSRSKTKLFAYGSSEQLPILGKFDSTIETKDKITYSCLHVVKGNAGSLMSYKTASALDLIHIKVNQVHTKQSKPVTLQDLEDRYPAIFNGIGKLKDYVVKLHIDENVQPVAQAARRIPFHLRKKVSTTLRDLENQGIIEKVEERVPHGYHQL